MFIGHEKPPYKIKRSFVLYGFHIYPVDFTLQPGSRSLMLKKSCQVRTNWNEKARVGIPLLYDPKDKACRICTNRGKGVRQPCRPDFLSLRLSLFCMPNDSQALPTIHGHIIIRSAGSPCTQPSITVLKFIYLKLIFRSHITLFCYCLDDRVMFLHPTTTINRLYFNHD
ncbi:Uncharacterised protein [Serratia quinivorans]|nr:Uncharacterised protein [Serratia quinivorans]